MSAIVDAARNWNMGRLRWRPISEYTAGYGAPVLVAAPELLDLDFNVEGVSTAYFADHTLEGETGDTWIADGWDPNNDCPFSMECNPTHFITIDGNGPYTQAEKDAYHEAQQA